MAYKCLYIDDQDVENLQPYIQAVSGEELSIESRHPLEFSYQEVKNYDCIILDWRLNEIVSAGGKPFELRAGALAQEIRTRETERLLPPMPLILWSTYQKLTGSYFGDQTSHDLFDMLYVKDVVVDTPKVVMYEISSLITGYKNIINSSQSDDQLKPFQLLKTSEQDFDKLSTALSNLLSQWKSAPIHEIARFLLKEMVFRPGPLMSEDLLASRLGIDRHNSAQWQDLLGLFDFAKYYGPFHEAWPRWWSLPIEINWWKSLSAKTPSLLSLSASQRVKLIQDATGIKEITAFRPTINGYSDRFQTICEVDNTPLDIVDAIMIDEKEPSSWQYRKYMSLDAALRRRYDENKMNPHPLERERLRSYEDD